MFDVIVVGYGLAGGVAAIEAHDAGARVLLLEKDPTPGGISICAGGGSRITIDVLKTFEYLKETTAGTTPDAVLMAFARGIADLPAYYRKLTEPVGAVANVTLTKGNYLVPGYESWGHINIDSVPGFDPAKEYPQVRADLDGGQRVFKVIQENVKMRRIATRMATPVERLWHENGEVKGVFAAGERIAASRAVILCCGGFEASADYQRQHWPIPPVLPAATLGNTGDGIRMAQEAGAGLWHMWHFHGVYGFRFPDPEYRLGIRIRRLRNWVPGVKPRQDTKGSWILVDQRGRRFMNEYEPYMQDTNHRPMHLYDPVTQTYPRIPSIIVVDAAGRALYPLAEPTWNDAATAAKFGSLTLRQFDEQILTTKPTLAEIAAEFGLDRDTFLATIAEWNAGCASGFDKAFGRLPGSMIPIVEPPFSAAYVWPIVSNTQGGIPHDECQRVLNSFDEPIRRLYVAGELGSIFGHLYIAGGNLAECFVGGRIAGTSAAHLDSWMDREAGQSVAATATA